MCTDITSTNKYTPQASKSCSAVSRDGSNLGRNSRSDLSRNSRISNSRSSRSFGTLNSKSSKPSGSFHRDYQSLCQGKRRHPVNFFKLNPVSSKLNLKLFADMINFLDWELIIKALQDDRTLASIWVQNRRVGILKLGNFDDVDTREKAERFDRVPVILTRFLMLKFIGSVAQCLSKTDVLTDLHLEALPLRSDYIAALCKGLESCPSLSRLALPYCLMGDDVCAVLCRTLKHVTNIKVLDLTCCGLTHVGVGSIADVIKFQQLWRAGECWERCLRYRKPDLEAISGLRRVTLNNNLIGDAGALKLINVLADDKFIKAIDLQACQLTERIGPVLLEVIEANDQLLIFDVRLNQLSDDWVQHILGRLQVGRVPSARWRWIRAETCPNNVWKSGSKIRKISSTATTMSSRSSTNWARHTSKTGSASEIRLLSGESRVSVSVSGDTEFYAVPERNSQAFRAPGDKNHILRPNMLNHCTSDLDITLDRILTYASTAERARVPRCSPECSAAPEQNIPLSGIPKENETEEPWFRYCTPNLDHLTFDVEKAHGPMEGSSVGADPMLICEPTLACPDCGCGPLQWKQKQKVVGNGSDCKCVQWTAKRTKSVSFDMENEESGSTGVCARTGNREGDGDKSIDGKASPGCRCKDGSQRLSAVSRVHADFDTDSLLTVDGINQMQRLEADPKSSGHKNCKMALQTSWENSLTSRKSNEKINSFSSDKRAHLKSGTRQDKLSQTLCQTSLKNSSTCSSANEKSTYSRSDNNHLDRGRSREKVSQTSLQTSLTCSSANENTYLLSKDCQTFYQTSLANSLPPSGSNEKDVPSHSVDSILRAVFLGPHRTKRSITNASSGSNSTVSSFVSTDSSNSGNSTDTGVSSCASSSRAKLIKLLLKKDGFPSNSQFEMSSCKQIASQYVKENELLEAVS